jgi:hypothetical protein
MAEAIPAYNTWSVADIYAWKHKNANIYLATNISN